MAAQWFYRRAGAKHGPVSSGKIRRMVERGEIEPTDLLWKEGMKEWRPAGESATLFGRDEVWAADRRRDPVGGSKRPPHRGRAPAALNAAAPWTGRRPLLASIGIGVAAGVVISAILAAVIVAFSGSLPEEIEAPAVAVVPRPKPVAAPPQPAAVKPAAEDVAAAPPAPAETLAAGAAPIAAEKSPADPPAEPQAETSQPGLPADLQAESSPQPRSRIRVLLPGEDF